MAFLSRLAFLFVLVPILELMLLIRVGEWIGFWPTLGIVVVTGVTGAALARAEGMRVFWQFQKELARGRLPGQALQDGIAVLVGGAFLLTPGILTDLTGFTLLFPPTRRWVQKRVRAALERRIRSGAVRFTVMGPGGFGMPFGNPGQPASDEADAPPHGLDPEKEIRVPARDDDPAL
jgi:UPF0716 protein FxsA